MKQSERHYTFLGTSSRPRFVAQSVLELSQRHGGPGGALCVTAGGLCAAWRRSSPAAGGGRALLVAAAAERSQQGRAAAGPSRTCTAGPGKGEGGEGGWTGRCRGLREQRQLNQMDKEAARQAACIQRLKCSRCTVLHCPLAAVPLIYTPQLPGCKPSPLGTINEPVATGDGAWAAGRGEVATGEGTAAAVVVATSAGGAFCRKNRRTPARKLMALPCITA